MSEQYAQPQALRQAVEDRLRLFAKQQPGTSLADLQRQLAYDRLLSRVFHVDGDRWVLKGATAMLARLGTLARHTADIDLYREHGIRWTADTGGPGWRAGYVRVARDAPLLAERDLDSAMETVRKFVDPVLRGVAAGSWKPDTLEWSSEH